MAPPKFAWPFKKLDEESPQATQTVAKDRDVRRPAPTESKPRSQPRPARTMWTQLTLRTISLLASISTLAIAAYVGAGPIQRIWPVVFVSSIFTIILNTSEILALLRSRLPALKIPRLHPIVLIIADFLAIGLLIWSFLALFLPIYIGRQDNPVPISDAELFITVEIWLTAGIGFIHALLFVFDCIDCCSVRSPNSRVDELSHRRKRRGTSRVGEDVIEMDWG
ncbi:hypothetical protein IFR04_010385 [Cadophora malorum]|uniref:Uncharacterized protein n=1 Tax=Cadophora malorum TaxID=108018 RepID=A0A8H7TBA1_9HELO|nr:hypothetical protein IFR04_010385 [Cadophora malorum]